MGRDLIVCLSFLAAMSKLLVDDGKVIAFAGVGHNYFLHKLHQLSKFFTLSFKRLVQFCWSRVFKNRIKLKPRIFFKYLSSIPTFSFYIAQVDK